MTRFWGKSSLEQPTVYYTRRRDRLHALISRRKRLKLRALQMLAESEATAIDMQRACNRLLSQRLLGE